MEWLALIPFLFAAMAVKRGERDWITTAGWLVVSVIVLAVV